MTEIERYREVLNEIKSNGSFSASDRITLKVIRKYEYEVRKLMKGRGYHAVSTKDPTNHKNWKYFKKLEKLCEDNKWDISLYIEAQFDRAKNYWSTLKQKYPLPSQLCSEKGQEYFVKWRHLQKEIRKENVYGTGIKAREAKSYRQELIEGIFQSCESIARYVKSPEDKFLTVYDSWISLNPAYLWTIPWFRDMFDEVFLPDSEGKDWAKVTENMQTIFYQIDRSKKLQEVVVKATAMAEKEYNLPENLDMNEE